MSTFTIENAKSGRAACKKCKGKIGKGDLRIGTHSDLGDKVMTKWSHVTCFSLPRKFSNISVEEFIDDHLTDDTETSVLKDPTQRQQIIEQIGLKLTKKEAKKSQTKKAPAPASGYMATLKRNAAQLLDGTDGEDRPATKKVKLSDDDKSKAEAYNKFSGLKIPELQDILTWNNVVKTGTKEVLLTRVIDGFVYGRIGKCVVCKEGRPKITDDGGAIECTGYFNNQKGYHAQCGNRIAVESAKRYEIG